MTLKLDVILLSTSFIPIQMKTKSKFDLKLILIILRETDDLIPTPDDIEQLMMR